MRVVADGAATRIPSPAATRAPGLDLHGVFGGVRARPLIAAQLAADPLAKALLLCVDGHLFLPLLVSEAGEQGPQTVPYLGRFVHDLSRWPPLARGRFARVVLVYRGPIARRWQLAASPPLQVLHHQLVAGRDVAQDVLDRPLPDDARLQQGRLTQALDAAVQTSPRRLHHGYHFILPHHASPSRLPRA